MREQDEQFRMCIQYHVNNGWNEVLLAIRFLLSKFGQFIEINI